jgi:hypothetical protein
MVATKDVYTFPPLPDIITLFKHAPFLSLQTHTNR